MKALWALRDFRVFWVGEAVSLLGAQVSTLAIPLLAIEILGASETEVGILRFVQLAPYLFLALFFGVWVDRSRRRIVMIGANLVRVACLVTILVLNSYGILTLPSLLVLACLAGIAAVAFDVSWMSFVPALVPEPERLPQATATLSATSWATDVGGPGLAGLLLSVVTAPIALLVDAISYLVSVATLVGVRAEEPRPANVVRSVGTEFREGLAWVFGDPMLRALALIGFCCNLSMVTTWTLFLAFGAIDLALPPFALGIVLSAASVGGLTGALLSGRLTRWLPIGKIYLVAQSMLLLGPLLIPLASGSRATVLALAIASFFTSYLGLGVANVIIVSVRQAVTPQHVLGRMTAVFRTLLFGGGALGGLLAGGLSTFGSRPAILLIAIASALVVPIMARTPVVRLSAYPTASPADEVALAG